MRHRLIICDIKFELAQDVIHHEVFHRSVDYHTEGAVFIVLTDQGHRLVKVRILQFRHCHQEVVRKRGKAGF